MIEPGSEQPTGDGTQLRMGFSRFDTLAAPRMPPGYGLRAFRPGDQAAWLAMLQQGSFGAWDHARLERLLADRQVRVPRDGIFFATRDERPVAAACAMLHHTPGGVVPELGWVVADPSHRGHGLALQVCRAVLGYIRGLGFGYTFLLTEAFRLPALATYLRLGFEPEMLDDGQPALWAELRRKLTR